jgi:hypothetical protein
VLTRRIPPDWRRRPDRAAANKYGTGVLNSPNGAGRVLSADGAALAFDRA